MKKTLLLTLAALALTAGCRVYEDEAAVKKIGGIAARNAEDRDKALRTASGIMTRLDEDVRPRSERIQGYLARRAEEAPRKLERQRARIREWREDGRELTRRDALVTEVTADMVVEGTVEKVEGDTVHIVSNDGRPLALKAARNSHVVADNREIPAATLPVGFPVRAAFGSVEGESYYYEVVADTSGENAALGRRP